MKLLVVVALLCGLMVLATAFQRREDVSSGAGRLIPAAKSYRFNVSSGCPHGWTYFNYRCFVYVPKYTQWGQAERNCLSMGAHLASVHNSDEYHVIQKLTAIYGYQTTWIGGTYAPEENIWLWSDGSAFHYTDWCPGEPSSGGQNCLQINYSASKCWDNLECGSRLPSVCAKRSTLLG